MSIINIPKYKRNEGLIFLDKENTIPSYVNQYLTCRDGIVNMIEFNEDSGYGVKCRFFRCSNTKYESECIVLQKELSGIWKEEIISIDFDSFKYLEILLGIKKDIDNKIIIYRDYNK